MSYLFPYLKFTRDNLRFIAFGFFMLFISSIGQTFFIGIFGPSIRAEFGLTHAAWGAVYMIGTVMSALVLPLTGQKIDTTSLSRYTIFVLIGLSIAAIFMAFVPSVAFLIFAIFLLRQTGQGLSSHTGSTAMARYFPHDRGKAVAVASLGFAMSETIFPVLMVITISIIGWRYTYGMAGLIVLVIFLPLALWLLKGQNKRHQNYESQQNIDLDKASTSWSRRDILCDFRFYLLLPAILAPHFICTALFFNHLVLAETKGWGATWFTASYWIYAVASVITMLASGPLIDRFSAIRILPTFLLPMVVGLIIVWAFDSSWWAWPYLALIGITSGITYTCLTVFWAEIYGTKFLGAIKSMFGSMGVFSSALGPVTMGFMMDQGISMERICIVFAFYSVGVTILLIAVLRRFDVINSDHY